MPDFSAVCHTFGTYRPGSAERKSPWVLGPGAFSCLERLVPKVRVELTRSCPHRFLRPPSTESPGNTSTYHSLSPGTHYAGGYVLMRSGNCRSLSHDLSHAGRAMIIICPTVRFCYRIDFARIPYQIIVPYIPAPEKLPVRSMSLPVLTLTVSHVR